jgi:hypothetical protein
MMATRLVKRARVTPKKSASEPLERLRENAPRRRSAPVSFACALSALMKERTRVNRSRRTRVQRAWEMALLDVSGLAEDSARHTQVWGAKGGVVNVAVDSPALAHELGVVYKAQLLAAMQALLDGKDTITGLIIRPRGGRRSFRG